MNQPNPTDECHLCGKTYAEHYTPPAFKTNYCDDSDDNLNVFTPKPSAPSEPVAKEPSPEQSCLFCNMVLDDHIMRDGLHICQTQPADQYAQRRTFILRRSDTVASDGTGVTTKGIPAEVKARFQTEAYSHTKAIAEEAAESGHSFNPEIFHAGMVAGKESEYLRTAETIADLLRANKELKRENAELQKNCASLEWSNEGLQSEVDRLKAERDQRNESQKPAPANPEPLERP